MPTMIKELIPKMTIMILIENKTYKLNNSIKNAAMELPNLAKNALLKL
jgi:hypothetical protein